MKTVLEKTADSPSMRNAVCITNAVMEFQPKLIALQVRIAQFREYNKQTTKFSFLDLVYDIEQAVCEFPDIANRTGCSGKYTVIYVLIL